MFLPLGKSWGKLQHRQLFKQNEWTVNGFSGKLRGAILGAGKNLGERTMKYVLGLVGFLLVWTCSAGAQVNVGNEQLLTAPTVKLDSTLAVEPLPAADPVPFLSSPAPHPTDTLGLSEPAPAASPAPPQGVYGVFQTYSMEVYIGYTFYRFYEIPSITQNLNGFNVSMQYYITDWFGLDGEFASGWGSQGPYTAHGCFGGGGPRVRWSAGHGIELWGHGMVGGSCFNLKTPYGGTDSLAYQVGGGVDINAHHHRFAYRLAADMVGTTFYGTTQYSPKFSAGVVFKF